MLKTAWTWILILATGCGSAASDEVERVTGELGTSGSAQNCTNGSTRSCGTDEGACVAGTQTCTQGKWSTCRGRVGPTVEKCNGVDDDCNGATDEGFALGESCDTNHDGCLDGAIGCSPEGQAVCTQDVPQIESASRMGIDQFLVFQPVNADAEAWAARHAALAEAGVGWVNFAGVGKGETGEVDDPGTADSEEGSGWATLDAAVRAWQDAGFQIVVGLTMSGQDKMDVPVDVIEEICGADESCRLLFNCVVNDNNDRRPLHMDEDDVDFCLADRLPADQAVYESWLEALVERYDCDGDRDAPGDPLRFPVRHYQVGAEYSSLAYWSGTEEDYRTLLSIARPAAETAYPEAVIVSNGIRWNDLFHGHPDGQAFGDSGPCEEHLDYLEQTYGLPARKVGERHGSFVEATVLFSADGNYDVLDAGGNGPFADSSEGYMTWVLDTLGVQEVADSPVRIWDMEARSEPRVEPNDVVLYHSELTAEGGSAVAAAVRRVGAGQPWNGDQELADAYRSEQAAVLAQVLVSRYVAGFEKVFMGNPSDWNSGTWIDYYLRVSYFAGLHDIAGSPYPAFYSYLLVAQMLNGFTSFETLHRNSSADDPPEGGGDELELHKFYFADGKEVLVAWQAEDVEHGATAASRRPDEALPPIRLSLTAEGDELPAAANGEYCVFATPTTPTEADGTPVSLETGESIELDVTQYPVFIVSRELADCD